MGMGMGMGIGVGGHMSLSCQIRCSFCNSADKHEPYCPMGILKKLTDLQRFIECPACLEKQVDVNSSDFYECRSCNTQFTTGDLFANEDTCSSTMLDDPRREDLVRVLILPDKGIGDFPLDRRVEKARQAYERACAESSVDPDDIEYDILDPDDEIWDADESDQPT